MVLEAVNIMLGEKTDWSSCKSVIVDINFMDRLKSYDRNNIPEACLKKIKPYISKTEFDPIYVGKQSQACKSLCLWVRAMDNYAKIN
jgi:dynein heavy chain, axonemal